MNAGWKLKPGLVLAFLWIAVLVLIGIFANLLAPFDPIAQNNSDILMPPSGRYLLGTDDIGRDVASRLIYGTRPTLIGTMIAIVTTTALGVPWGLASGYFQGWPDQILMRTADAVMVFPGIVLALAITAALGQSLVTTMMALGFVFSPLLARIVRSGVLTLRNRDFVQVTRLYGGSTWYRLFHHVLPNVLPALTVQLTLLCGISVLAQTGLNFLGLGVPAPNPSWGSSMAETFRYVVVNPMAPVIPGLVVAATVLAIYRIGDHLRDILEVWK